MAYEALDASVRLLQGELSAAQVLRLSRRTRHLAVAADRDGDVAATLFVRRGVNGEPWLDAHALDRTGPSWRVLGGGSGNGADDLFEPRPRLDDLQEVALSLGAGGCVRNAQRLMPWGAKCVRWEKLRLVSEVTTLALPMRNLPVAAHGVAIVVWASRKPPRVVALAGDGREIGPVRIGLR